MASRASAAADERTKTGFVEMNFVTATKVAVTQVTYEPGIVGQN